MEQTLVGFLLIFINYIFGIREFLEVQESQDPWWMKSSLLLFGIMGGVILRLLLYLIYWGAQDIHDQIVYEDEDRKFSWKGFHLNR